MAFLVCSDFCGEIGLRKAGLGGTHPLTLGLVCVAR
ncbi:DUF3265 domain-containing protein [Vibrio vulnificus]|nr:DUF3265 domain-containing protein [Vibrio vulnificus]HAS8228043.1 DUF3265 domain-containing protein [Vibrio vulnificus]